MKKMNSLCCITTLALIVVTLISHFTSVSAIHCWDCASNINPNCGDPFNKLSFAKIDCDQVVKPHLINMNATLCRKIVQRIENDPIPRIVRTCGWISDDSTDGECVRRSGTFSVLVEYCT